MYTYADAAKHPDVLLAEALARDHADPGLGLACHKRRAKKSHRSARKAHKNVGNRTLVELLSSGSVLSMAASALSAVRSAPRMASTMAVIVPA